MSYDKGDNMIITIKLTEKQMKQINNLMMNCYTKQDMFEHLIHIGINAFNAVHMSNSFAPIRNRDQVFASFTVLPISNSI